MFDRILYKPLDYLIFGKTENESRYSGIDQVKFAEKCR